MATENSQKLKKLDKLIYIAIGLFLITVFFYFSKFDNGLSNNNADWGTFGDFMGGTLNPLFALFSLFAIIYTIKIQTEELELSREELKATKEELIKSREAQEEQSKSFKIQNESIKLQSFENTLFKLNEVFNDVRNSIIIQVDIFGLDSGSIRGDGGNYQEYQGVDINDSTILDCIKTSKFISFEAIKKYLEIYKKAREKALEAKKEAIKAFLEAKKIKETYLLDEWAVDSSDEEDFLNYEDYEQ